jgi:hypothetical protein
LQAVDAAVEILPQRAHHGLGKLLARSVMATNINDYVRPDHSQDSKFVDAEALKQQQQQKAAEADRQAQEAQQGPAYRQNNLASRGPAPPSPNRAYDSSLRNEQLGNRAAAGAPAKQDSAEEQKQKQAEDEKQKNVQQSKFLQRER